MKTKLLFGLFASLSLVLTGCDKDIRDQFRKAVNKCVNVKPDESLELLSKDSYSIKEKTFYPAAPVFVEGHIDHFVIAEYRRELIDTVLSSDYYFCSTINIKAKTTGSLYFDINFTVSDAFKDSIRIELYETTKNKSVIYSYNGGESLTEGTFDLNADGLPDKKGTYDWDENSTEYCVYTTGEHSYQTEKFSETPYLTVNENDELTIRINFWFDGFYSENNPEPADFGDLDLLFSVK